MIWCEALTKGLHIPVSRAPDGMEGHTKVPFWVPYTQPTSKGLGEGQQIMRVVELGERRMQSKGSDKRRSVETWTIARMPKPLPSDPIHLLHMKTGSEILIPPFREGREEKIQTLYLE